LFSSKPYKRAQRVSDNIRREIANIFSFEISDPRLKSLTVTEVKLSDDLSSAKIFLSNYLNQALNEDRTAFLRLWKIRNHLSKKSWDKTLN